MRHQIIDKFTYFGGNVSPSLEGIQAWQSTVQVITDPTQPYPERLSKAVQILGDFISRADESPNRDFKPGMEKMMNALIQVTDFHMKLWSHCVAGLTLGVREPSSELLKKYNDIWERHASLEKSVERSKQYYLKCLAKWTDIHERLSGVLSAEYLRYDNIYAPITSKVDVALTKYQSHYRREVNHRSVLLKQIEKMKPGFIDQEKNKIDDIFNTLKELLCKMEKFAPKSIRGVEELLWELDSMNSWEMASAGWAACEKTHVFSKYEGPKGTDPMCPAEPVLIVKDVEKVRCPTELFSGKSETSYAATESIEEYHPKENNKKDVIKEVASECSSKSKVKRVCSDNNAEKVCGTSTSDGNTDERQTKVRKLLPKFSKDISEDTISVKDLRKCDNHKIESQKEQQTPWGKGTHTEGSRSADVSTMSGVKVVALKDRVKQSSKEISIRSGMKIKQTKAANKDGMAYGYKRVRLGIKKYGFYPANLVSLYKKDAKD